MKKIFFHACRNFLQRADAERLAAGLRIQRFGACIYPVLQDGVQMFRMDAYVYRDDPAQVAALKAAMPPGSERGRLPKYDWASVDWNLSNREIIELLGCSRQSVEKRRP